MCNGKGTCRKHGKDDILALHRMDKISFEVYKNLNYLLFLTNRAGLCPNRPLILVKSVRINRQRPPQPVKVRINLVGMEGTLVGTVHNVLQCRIMPNARVHFTTRTQAVATLRYARFVRVTCWLAFPRRAPAQTIIRTAFGTGSPSQVQ